MRNLTLIAAVLALAACPRRGNDGDGELAELSADSTQTTSDEGSLLSGLMDGASANLVAVTADQAAAALVARAEARYNPNGCLAATQSGSTVTLVFANCIGPRGLRALNGTLTATVSVDAAGAIVVAASASDFHIGLSTLDIDATATYTGSGASQQLAVVTHTTGVGGLGFSLEHDGDYTLTWDASCVSLEGAWSTERGDASRSTTADVTRCIAECPIGTITRDTFRGRTIAITFDGTSTASWSSSAGGSGTFQLACQ